MDPVFKKLLEVLGGLTSVTAIVAALCWLFKKFVETWITRRLESFGQELKNKSQSELEALRAKLQVETQMAIEKTRSELQLRALERQVQFSKLHELRADVIRNLYQKLNHLLNAAGIYLIGPRVDSQKYEAFKEKMAEFESYFDDTQIFFRAAFCQQIKEFLTLVRGHANEKFMMADVKPFGEEERREHRERNMERWNLITEKAPAIKTEFQNEFRRLLGVEDYSESGQFHDAK